MKSYSVAIQDDTGLWITNWHKYDSPNDVNWAEVENFCKSKGYKAYGYYYGHKSNQLTSSRCRTILKTLAA